MKIIVTDLINFSVRQKLFEVSFQQNEIEDNLKLKSI